MAYIQRRIANEILTLLDHFPVVGIVGPRQAGKTTLAKHLVNHIQKECLYLDLEFPEDSGKLIEPQLYLEQHRDKCIVLDEIQRMPELFPLLRALIDQHRVPGRFMILGSASPHLLRQSSESLAGRIAYKELAPFHLTEILPHESFTDHWFFGGFPEAFLSADPSIRRTWLRNFIQTYVERDLPQLGFTASPAITQRLLRMLAHFHGGVWNASSFSKSLGITVPTVNRYLQFLEEAFLIHRLQPFYSNIKKRLVRAPKVYFRDSGILHYLAGIQDFDQLQGNVLIGHSWEGYVIEQIKQILPEDLSLYFYRTHHGAESDLVIVRGNTPVSCIEIKYSSQPKPSKGFRIAIQDLGTSANYVLTPKSECYNVGENIKACNLVSFLKEGLSQYVNNLIN